MLNITVFSPLNFSQIGQNYICESAKNTNCPRFPTGCDKSTLWSDNVDMERPESPEAQNKRRVTERGVCAFELIAPYLDKLVEPV